METKAGSCDIVAQPYDVAWAKTLCLSATQRGPIVTFTHGSFASPLSATVDLEQRLRMKRESKAGAQRETIEQSGRRARNTLGSSQLPTFAFGLSKLEKETPSGTFYASTSTGSDEGIEGQKESFREPNLPTASRAERVSSGSTHRPNDCLSYLGDSSSLFSDLQADSPRGSNRSKLATPQPEIIKPFRLSSPSPPNMVVEREPPKTTPQKPVQPPFSNVQQPQFGQPSPLQNRLQKPSQHPQGVFNIPKPHQHRPEHHRTTETSGTEQPRAASNDQPNYMRPTVASKSPDSSQPRPMSGPQPAFIHPFRQSTQPLPQYQVPSRHPHLLEQPYQLMQRQPQPLQPRADHGNADVIEIPRPTNAPSWNSYARPQPTFSAFGPSTSGFTSVNDVFKKHFGDLTRPAPKPQSSFDPPGLFDEPFGATDPYTYVDAGKAAENIKALLEGAFEDEEDKPRTRSRKKKSVEAAADGLVDGLKDLAVKGEDEKGGKDKQEGEGEEEVEDDLDDGTVEGLKVKLLPHQVEGVDWMRDKEIGTKKKNRSLPKGGILADDMGLGKTIQSIALILTNPRPAMNGTSTSVIDKKALPATVGKNTLVVAPLALIKQWEAEIKNRVEETHKLKVLVHHGPQRTKNFQDLKKYDVVITTYQILVSEHSSSSKGEDGPQAGCFGIHWYRIILDEAHTIKNRNAKSTQACYALRSEYRWCLTGTPMQNNLDELQSLIKFLRIKPYNDISVWKDQITRPMSQGRGGVAIKRLQFYLKAFMKRRTKDILKKEGALNPGGRPTSKDGASNGFKITQRRVESLLVGFSPEERLFYDRLEQRTDKSLEAMMNGAKMNYASALVLLLRLRQACNHSKLLGGSLSKDNDALTTGQTSPTKKAKAADKDIDDMADLLCGLSVQTKQCDVCQIDLSTVEVSAGLIRCSECEADLAGQSDGRKQAKAKKWRKRHTRKTKSETTSESQTFRAAKKKNVILDSDEEQDGDRADPVDQPDPTSPVLGSRSRKIHGLNTYDKEADNESDASSSEEEEDDDTDSSEETSPTQTSPTASAKIRHLLTILHRESSAHKFIVYSQFTSMLDLIEPFLRTAKLSFTRYDGSMRNELREASLERLRNDNSCRILLCSLKCGSLGLNLTAASRVVILEPFWNPFVEEQAIDRVHRLNQTVDVVVYKLTVEDTVEARILELQEKKRALATAAIEGKAVGKLSMKDILNLFKRDAELDLRHELDSTLGMRKTILTGSTSAVASDLRFLSSRVTPPVMEKGKGVGHRGEDSIYGRRW